MTRILVIEDSSSLRGDIVEMLGYEGYEAIGAENGLIGLEMARTTRPDLVLCDIMMPEMDGFGVLEELRRDVRTATIPFIFLTARVDRLDVRQGMSLGADDFLTKPFTVNELMTSVRARLQKKQEIERAAAQQMDSLRGSIILALPHELRTPLNVILGFSDLMTDEAEPLEPESMRDMARHIHSAATRLYHLTENYLTYAQTELIRQDPTLLDGYRSGYLLFPRDAVLHYAVDVARAAGRESDLTIELDDVSCLAISEESLRKIVSELVDNACKFSPPGTTIQVTGRAHEEGYALQVADRGRGMTAEQIANVGAYNQFGRRLYEDQGSGLGLVIARRLVELAGGSLTVDSQPGVATLVTVRLPYGDESQF